MLSDFSVNAVCRIPLHPQEQDRLATVCGPCEPGGASDPTLDAIAETAARLFATPMGLVTSLWEEDQWISGRVGTDLEHTRRDESFCAQTILSDVPLVVEDARTDPRFAHLKTVTGEPYVRFYAGAPIVDAEGLPLGAVCVLDTKPGEASSLSLAGLERLAAKVGVILETRRLVRELLGSGTSGDAGGRTLARLERILKPLGAPLERSRASI